MPAPRTLLSAYRHPTTACFIDDNESFMAGLAAVLPRHMSSVAFFDPVDALDFVNRPQEIPPLADRCLSAPPMAEQVVPEPIHPVPISSVPIYPEQPKPERAARAQFILDTDLIEQEVNLVQRFNKLSVVIVDYSMPTLNGLQFCEKIRDPHIGKILLTGVADEKMAVEAFNAGIIDRFIAKNHPNATDHISEFAREMENAFFRSQTDQLQRILSLSGQLFLDDRAVAKWVHRLMARENFCEYYMVSDPPGLILVTTSGEIAQLVVLTAEQCDAQVQFAKQQQAPGWVVQRLIQRSHIGFFLEHPASYSGGETYPWNELLIEAHRLGNQSRSWYAGLVAQPPPSIDYRPASACHDAWVAARNSQRPPKGSSLLH